MSAGFWGELLRVGVALALALALFAGGVAIWRALARLPGTQQKDFRVRRRLALTPRASVVEIEHEGRRYLLLLAGEQLRPLPPHFALPDAPPAKKEDMDS